MKTEIPHYWEGTFGLAVALKHRCKFGGLNEGILSVYAPGPAGSSDTGIFEKHPGSGSVV
jgi:hypothetical protein